MDLKQYVRDAIRTESRIESIQSEDTEITGLQMALQCFIASSQILDMYKKNIFYKKPINHEKRKAAIANLVSNAGGLDAGYFHEHYKHDQLPVDPRVFHAIIGILTEAGELAEALDKTIRDEGTLDVINVSEEIGDISWYTAIAIDALGGDWDNILETNIAKLKKRYPEKFTSKDAIDRDVAGERELLDDLTYFNNKPETCGKVPDNYFNAENNNETN